MSVLQSDLLASTTVGHAAFASRNPRLRSPTQHTCGANDVASRRATTSSHTAQRCGIHRHSQPLHSSRTWDDYMLVTIVTGREEAGAYLPPAPITCTQDTPEGPREEHPGPTTADRQRTEMEEEERNTRHVSAGASNNRLSHSRTHRHPPHTSCNAESTQRWRTRTRPRRRP